MYYKYKYSLHLQTSIVPSLSVNAARCFFSAAGVDKRYIRGIRHNDFHNDEYCAILRHTLDTLEHLHKLATNNNMISRDRDGIIRDPGPVSSYNIHGSRYPSILSANETGSVSNGSRCTSSTTESFDSFT